MLVRAVLRLTLTVGGDFTVSVVVNLIARLGERIEEPWKIR